MIKFRCSNCDKKIGVPEKYAGRLVKCPRCSEAARVPELEPGPEIEAEFRADVEGETESFPGTETEGEAAGETEMEGEEREEAEKVQAEEILGLSGQEPEMLSDYLEVYTPPVALEKPRCPHCEAEVSAETEFCNFCGRAIAEGEGEDEGAEGEGKTKLIKSVTTGKGFGKDLLSLMSPIKSGSDAIVFFFFLIVYVLANIQLPVTVWLMFYAQLLLQGLVFIFLFNVLLETANGNNHLPMIDMPHSSWEIIRPYLQVVVSSVYAFFPFISMIIVVVVISGIAVLGDVMGTSEVTYEDPYAAHEEEIKDILSDLGFEGERNYEGEFDPERDYFSEPNDPMAPEEFTTEPDIFADEPFVEDLFAEESYAGGGIASLGWAVILLLAALFCLGLFISPMVILNIVLGDTFFVNPLKVLLNITRTFKAYIFCCLAVFAAAGLTYLSVVTFTLEGMEGSNIFLICAMIAAMIGGFSIEIYSMRVLGLLYRYYEEKLDW